MARHRPPRPYGQLMESLRMVWRIEPILSNPVWSLGQPSLALLPSSFRLGVWNICKGAGGRLFEHDYRVLAYHSDLVLLQEALLSKRAMQTFCEPGFGVMHGASYQRTDKLRDGVATISRAACATDPIVVPCQKPEPVFRTPKVALVTQHNIEGSPHPLTVINVHSTLVRSASQAVAELDHMFSMIPELPGPAILSGDFNTFTNGIFKRVCARAEASGFEYVPISNDPRSKTSKLDHAFVKDVEVENCEVVETIRSSDHFPLLFHLRVS